MKKQLLLLVCLLAIMVSLIVIFRMSCEKLPAYDPSMDRCLGQRIATETAKLINSQGDVVVLATRGGQVKDDEGQSQLDGLQEEFKRRKTIQVVAIEGPADEQTYLQFVNARGIPEEFFQAVLAKYTNVQAIVSLLGVPIVSSQPKEIDVVKLPSVPVVALDLSGQQSWKELMASGVVHTIICWKQNLGSEQPAKKGDCNLHFSSRYTVVTRESLGNPDGQAR